MTMLLAAFPDEYDLRITERMLDRLASLAMAFEQYADIKGTNEYVSKMDRYSSFGPMGVWPDGEDVPMDAAVKQYDYSLTQVFYGRGFASSRKLRKYHRFGTVQGWADSLVDSAVATMRTKHAYPLVNAFATVTYGDGKVLCATDHPGSGAATRSNKLASASVLSVAAWEAVLLLGARMTDYRGKADPKVYDQCIVGPDQAPKALKLFGSTKEAFTTDNQENIHTGVTPINETEITSTTAWFGQDSNDRVIKSLFGQEYTPGYYRKNNGDDVFFGEMDFVVGCTHFESIAGTPGA